MIQDQSTLGPLARNLRSLAGQEASSTIATTAASPQNSPYKEGPGRSYPPPTLPRRKHARTAVGTKNDAPASIDASTDVSSFSPATLARSRYRT